MICTHMSAPCLTYFSEQSKGLAQEVYLHTLQNGLDQRVKRFTDALKREIEAWGFFDAARQSARRVLIAWAVILILLSPVLALAGVPLLMQTAIGPWPVLISGGLFFLGLAALVAGATLPPLSDQWAAEAARWDAFRQYLKAVTKGRESLPYASRYAEYLSSAAAFGLADVWANYLKRREDVEVPSWFHSLTGAQVASQAGFVAMIAAINASGAASGASASAAAGAAVGAAGGGASGAG